jgi:hypothetical protein
MVIYLGIDPSLAFSAVSHSAVVFEVALREETRRKRPPASCKQRYDSSGQAPYLEGIALFSRKECVTIIEGHARQSGAFQVV